MNPLTNVKNITKLNQIELERGTVDKKSWHDIYKESAWIFIGGLAYGLTEGDILSVFSQYGEIVNINLVRDKKTGKIKGFCFLCYANQKSTILAVDNFNGIKVCGRTIRVDHVANYKPPKENEDEDDITKQLKAEGCAPKPMKLESLSEEAPEKKKSKKVKKEKKKHKKHKKMDIKREGSVKAVKVKQERYDPGYAKYELSGGGRPNRKIQRSEDSESSSDESSGYDSSRLSNRESARSKATGKDRMHSSFESKSDEPNRSKIYRNKDTHKTNDFKRRHDDSLSSSDESGKRKKSHKTDFYKSKRPESSMHQSSTNAENSPDSSNEYKRYSTTNQRKSKESKNYDRSISPIKDKHSNKHSHKHKRHDSSPSTESDTAHKQKVRESEKSHSSQYEDRVRKGSHHKNYKDSRPSSSTNYFTDSDEKYKRSEQSHENGFSSPYKQNKNHSHVSRSSKAERKER